MDPSGPTVEILKGIRDEVRSTNERLEGLRDEVRSTNERLEGLRDEVRGTNERVDGLRDEVHTLRTDTNERLESLGDELQGLRADTAERFDETNGWLARLEHRQTETEVRLSTELVAVVGAVREVRDLLREDRALRDRVDDHERRIAAVETRVG